MARKNKRTLAHIAELIAGDLREFGYPDVTADMVKDAWRAMKAKTALPYGVIGMFVESKIKEATSPPYNLEITDDE